MIRLRRRTGDLAALGFYAAFACAANWPAWPGNPQLFRDGDQTSMISALAWMPFAIVHGLNPFFGNFLNYPVGVNYAQNVQSPLLTLLLAPLTMLAGPIAGLNLLDWGGFFLSAAALYLVLRRLALSRSGAFIAGLVYGFSPYMNGQAGPHTLLYFVPFPPVVALILVEMLCRQRGRPLVQGGVLGVLVAAQFLVQPEIDLTTISVCVIALVVLAIRFPERARAALRRSWRGLLFAGVIGVAGVAYPVWAATRGPDHYNGPAQGSDPQAAGGGLEADLLGTVVPTSFEALAPASIANFGDRLTGSDAPENGSYLGIPLVLLALGAFIVNRRDRWVQLTAAMAGIAWLLSLGGQLVVANHITFLRLPISLVALLPGFSSIESSRFALYTDLFLGVMLALAWDLWRKRRRARVHVDRRAEPHGRRFRPTPLEAEALILGLASVAFLVPNWPYPVGPANTPAFFTSKEVRSLAQGSVALIVPYPSVATLPPEVWQAEADFRFRMPGGYMYVRGAGGGPSLFPAILQPQPFFAWLWSLNGTGYPGMPSPPQVGPKLIQEARRFLVENHIDEVIWQGYSVNPATQVFDAALGEHPRRFQDTAVWYHVSERAHRLSS